ncbi:MAG TPA: hypothetical protein VEL76_36560 [Gemmataceae bacterium]|nr:hypothetical protein [Gemmataceae bacterium]
MRRVLLAVLCRTVVGILIAEVLGNVGSWKSCKIEGRPGHSGRPSWLWGVYSVTWEEEGSRALADDKVTG